MNSMFSPITHYDQFSSFLDLKYHTGIKFGSLCSSNISDCTGVVKISTTIPEAKCHNEAAEKIKPRQKLRNRAPTSLIFRPQTKVSLQNPVVSGMTFEIF